VLPDVTSEHDIHRRLSDASVPGKVSIHVHADIGLYCFKTDSGLSKTAEDGIIILRKSAEYVTKYSKKFNSLKTIGVQKRPLFGRLWGQYFHLQSPHTSHVFNTCQLAHFAAAPLT
jgi:hypothetical protein